VKGEVNPFSAMIWRALIDYLLDPSQEAAGRLRRLRDYLEEIERRAG